MAKRSRVTLKRAGGNFLDMRGKTLNTAFHDRQEIRETPGILGVHDLKTRRAGDLLLVDVHLDIDANLTVAQGHDIAVEARRRVVTRHPVLNLMTHVDPYPHS